MYLHLITMNNYLENLMSINKIIFYVALSLSLFFQSAVSAEIDTNRQKEILFSANKFKYMLEIAEQYYVDSVMLESVTDAAFKTLLSSLDIQSIYYPRQDFLKLQEQNKGDAEGIGADIVPLNDTLTIIKVIKDSPADSAGLLAGDKILFIEGKSTIGFTKNECDSLIRGDQGTTVHLIVKRQYGTSLLNEFNVVRNEYNLPSILSYFMMDGTKTGYIYITRFSAKTNTEMSEALLSLKKQGMQEVIFDLRGNLGGVVDGTLKALSNFFANNTELLKIRGRHNSVDTTMYSFTEGEYQKVKIFVVVDRNSASASEIFAGVMQDYDRGVIIGENTYAKGTVQKIWKMNDGTGFRLTIAEYETPSGRKIHKPTDSLSALNLDPAFELNSTKQDRERLIEMMRKTGGRTYMPTVLSKNGRIIFVKGGITPDIVEKNDTINVLTRVLIQKGIFLEFVYNFLYSEKEMLLQKYKADFKKFNRDYVIEDSFLDDFKKYSMKRNIWNEDYYQKDKEYFRDYLKALISYTLWGENGYRSVIFKRDRIINTALSTIPEYEKILKINN